MVSPCVAQPGIAGTSAQKPPSSASCTTTLIFMSPLLADGRKILIHAGNAKAAIAARFLAAVRAECRAWPQTTSASNDLRGGDCGIALPVASCNRPRQNSQDLSLIQPGWAASITSTKRCAPNTVSSRRTSSNGARLIACARILISERGCEPTGSHQKNFRSNSYKKSARGDDVRDAFIGQST